MLFKTFFLSMVNSFNIFGRHSIIFVEDMLNLKFEPVRRRDKANTRHTIVEEKLKILHFQRKKKKNME